MSETLNPTENHIGAVGGHSAVLDLTLSLDVAAYVSGDVLAASQELPNVLRTDGSLALVDMIQVLDEDKQAGAFDLLFFDRDTDVGAENAAYDITDAEMRNLLGWVRIIAGDYESWTNHATATLKRGDSAFKLSLLKPSSGTSVYVAAISRDTKTYTASGIRLKIHLIQD